MYKCIHILQVAVNSNLWCDQLEIQIQCADIGSLTLKQKVFKVFMYVIQTHLGVDNTDNKNDTCTDKQSTNYKQATSVMNLRH